MAVRFETEIDTIYTADIYKLQILDSEYSGSAIAFDALGPDGFTLNYSGSRNLGRFNPVFASDLIFKISVTDLIRSDVESFIDDMVQSGDEDRFKLKVLKNDALYWTGVILIDRVTKSIPLRSLEIRAIDGLGRISSIEYNNDGVSYSGKQSIRGHLFNVLNKLGVSDLFSASDIFFKSLVTWNEDDLTYSTAQNILDNARINHLALIKVDKKGNVTYNNAFRVLEEIAKVFGARVFQSDGSWWFWQVNEFKASTRAISKYTKSGTKTLEITSSRQPFSTWSVSGETDVKMTSGEIEWFAPLRAIHCDYKHYSTKNLIKALSFTDQEGTVEGIDSLGETSRLQFTSTITTFSSYTAATYRGHYQKFRLKIKIGDLYLQRPAKITSTGSFVYGNMVWLSSVEYYEFFTPLITTSNPATPITFPLEFITPPILQDGNMTVTFEYVNIYLTDGTVPELIDPPTGYDIADANVVILTLGTVDSETNTTRYKVKNAIQGNSDIIEFTTLFGDGPSGNSYGAIEVWNGEDWIVSNGWRKKTEGDPVEISQLLINEMISGQVKPVEKIVGTFVGEYEMHYTIKDPAGNHYVFNGGTLQARLNQWNGEWFNIETANTGNYTEGDKKEFVEEPIVITDIPADTFEPDYPRPTIPNTNDIGVYFQPSNPFVNIDIFTRVDDTQIDGGGLIDFIPIQAPGEDGLIREGDYFTILDPTTGNIQEFQAVRTVRADDFGIAVKPIAVNEDGFNPDSLILLSNKEIVKNGTMGASSIKEKWYNQNFTNVTGSAVTVTVNSGVLPSINSHLFVYVNGVHQDSGWYVEGSQIKFTWPLENNDVAVKFLITSEAEDGCCASSGLPLEFYTEQIDNVSNNYVQFTAGGGAMPTNAANLNVYVDGVYQNGGYTVQSDRIYFNWTLEDNTVAVQFTVDSPRVYNQNFENVQGATVTLSSKIAQMAQGNTRVMVFVDGIFQLSGYSISGSILTFNWTLDNNNVHIKVFK